MKKPIVLVLSTLMLGMSATAMADSNHRWDNYHGKDHNRYEQRHDYRYDHRNDHRAPVWSHSERGNHYGRYVAFKRGDRIPVEYVIAVIMFQIGVHIAYMHHHVDTTG